MKKKKRKKLLTFFLFVFFPCIIICTDFEEIEIVYGRNSDVLTAVFYKRSNTDYNITTSFSEDHFVSDRATVQANNSGPDDSYFRTISNY